MMLASKALSGKSIAELDGKLYALLESLNNDAAAAAGQQESRRDVIVDWQALAVLCARIEASVCLERLEQALMQLDSLWPLISFLLRYGVISVAFDVKPWIRAAKATPKGCGIYKSCLETLLNDALDNDRRREAACLLNGMRFPEWTEPQARDFKSTSKDDPEPRLSPLQTRHFAALKRPHEVMKKVTMMLDGKGSVQLTDLRQSPYVPNCSLVSSLLIMARNESKVPGFATSGLYPKNSKGRSILSPTGQYRVRLFWNGMYRTVRIDDRLPVDAQGRLLCVQSVSEDKCELWASLIEKAYMKLLVGGYDFWAGSNSGIDIYALTGWPPENLPLAPGFLKPGNTKAYEDDLWSKLIRAMNIKDNLVTACTRSDVNEEATGLPRSHAFAVLAASEEPIVRKRKLLLRNPWGQNSEGFWMHLDQVSRYFSSVHVNWNLALFSHVSHHHCTLPAPEQHALMGFHRTIQFRIRVSPETKIVWVLLSRHVHSAAELDSVENALACHAFESSERILLPEKSKTLAKGMYSSGPHSLLRVESVGSDGSFVIVASSYDAKRPVDATLSVFSTCKDTVVEHLPSCLGVRVGPMMRKLDVASPRIGAKNVFPFWLLRLPRIDQVLQGMSSIKLKVAVWAVDAPNGTTLDVDLVVLDIKHSCQQVYNRASSEEVMDFLGTDTSTKLFRCFTFAIPEILLKRSSVRYIVVPKFQACLGSPADSTFSYALEVESQVSVSVTPPDDSDGSKQQQATIARMLESFTHLHGDLGVMDSSSSAASVISSTNSDRFLVTTGSLDSPYNI